MIWQIAHTLPFFLLMAAMIIGVLGGLSVGGLHFFKRSGQSRANTLYALLLISFSFTLLHNIFILSDFYGSFPQYKFFPIYFTHAFGPLLFFHVKCNLYPGYQFKGSDSKHLILPLLQWIYMWQVFFLDEETKRLFDRSFYNPFYGALEQALYLSLFVAYLYFAWRYLIQRRQQPASLHERKQFWYLRKLLKAMGLLFAAHALFVVFDFIAYEFFSSDLRSVKLHVGIGALSFAAMVYWLSVYGFQVLLWGRRVFGKK